MANEQPRRLRRRRRHRRHGERRRRACLKRLRPAPRDHRGRAGGLRDDLPRRARADQDPGPRRGLRPEELRPRRRRRGAHRHRSRRLRHQGPRSRRREGLLVGISAGAAVRVALDVARELGPGKHVVTMLCRHRRALLQPRRVLPMNARGRPRRRRRHRRARGHRARRGRRRARSGSPTTIASSVTNLHRQILFDEADVGRPKLDAFADALGRRFAGVRGRTPSAARALPEHGGVARPRARRSWSTRPTTSRRASSSPTRARSRGVPVVHAAAVRLVGDGDGGRRPTGRPCYRCLFEDVPERRRARLRDRRRARARCAASPARIAADRALRVLDGRRLGVRARRHLRRRARRAPRGPGPRARRLPALRRRAAPEPRPRATTPRAASPNPVLSPITDGESHVATPPFASPPRSAPSPAATTR